MYFATLTIQEAHETPTSMTCFASNTRDAMDKCIRRLATYFFTDHVTKDWAFNKPVENLSVGFLTKELNAHGFNFQFDDCGKVE